MPDPVSGAVGGRREAPGHLALRTRQLPPTGARGGGRVGLLGGDGPFGHAARTGVVQARTPRAGPAEGVPENGWADGYTRHFTYDKA